LCGESYAQKGGESKKNAAFDQQELVEQMKAKGMSDGEIETWKTFKGRWRS
jgi:hypothetical protein